MKKLIINILKYKLFKVIGTPSILPINLTLSITYRCNSKCKTCNIWKKEKKDELTLEEWNKILRSIGQNTIWFTLTGGEPFLRGDLDKLVEIISKYNKPIVISIPTDGSQPEIIEAKTKQILKLCSGNKIRLIINLSLDGIDQHHDYIRGKNGSFAKAMESFNRLTKLKDEFNNFILGVHTVISKYNEKNIPEIYEYIRILKPDHHIFEIASQRKELDNLKSDVTPSLEGYFKALDLISKKNSLNKYKSTSRLIQLFRAEYYNSTKMILRNPNFAIPCYAGIASGQISPTGEVWPCCVRSDVIGSLREYNYDFKKIWYSKKMGRIRQAIQANRCSCTLANVNYTNILCQPKSLFKIGIKAAFRGLFPYSF